MNRKKWLAVGSVLVFALLCGVTLHRKEVNSFASLYGWNSDHPSHAGAAVALAQVGWRVFREPVEAYCLFQAEDAPRLEAYVIEQKLNPVRAGDLCFLGSGNPLMINWPMYPRFYPLGANLLSAIPAWLHHWNVISFIQMNRLLLFFFNLSCGTLFLIFLVWGLRYPSGDFQRYALWGLGVVAWNVVFQWTEQGVYDGVGVLCLIFAFYRMAIASRSATDEKVKAQAFFFFASAIFIHYRAIWYFPFGLSLLLGTTDSASGWRVDRRIFSSRWFWAGGVLLALSALTLFLSKPYMDQMPVNNSLHHSRLFAGKSGFALPVILLALFNLVFSVLARNFLKVALTVSLFGFLLLTPEVRIWHFLFQLPFLFVDFLGPNPEQGMKFWRKASMAASFVWVSWLASIQSPGSFFLWNFILNFFG